MKCNVPYTRPDGLSYVVKKCRTLSSLSSILYPESRFVAKRTKGTQSKLVSLPETIRMECIVSTSGKLLLY
jgi:hypothetical protein